MIYPAPPLPLAKTAPTPPPESDADIHELWENWHDEYVDYLNAQQTEHTYLRLTDEVPDDAVLVDRRGVFISKTWDGQDEYTRDMPEEWDWAENLLSIEGWDPESFLVLGAALGNGTWQELANEDTVPIRLATERDFENSRTRKKTLVRNASCGEGGQPRGEVYICDTYDEAVLVAKRTWKGKGDDLHSSKLLGLATSRDDCLTFVERLGAWMSGYAATSGELLVEDDTLSARSEASGLSLARLVSTDDDDLAVTIGSATVDAETFGIRVSGSGSDPVDIEVPADIAAQNWAGIASALDTVVSELLGGRDKAGTDLQ